MDITLQKQKALETRNTIIENISKNGGYLSSNLSCVDIIVSLFNYINEKDRIFFLKDDLSYAYELLSGKKAAIQSLSSIVASCINRNLNHEDYRIIAVLNSNHIRSGKDIEALKMISELNSQMVIIFNDDTMISEGIGVIDKVVSSLRNTKTYNNLKNKVKDVIRNNKNGDKYIEDIHNIKSEIRKSIVNEGIFGGYDIDYQGPIDGNNLNELNRSIEICLSKNHPVILHCLTQSGKGYPFSENSTTDYWYQVDRFNIDTGKPLVSEVEGYKFIKHVIADEVAKNMLSNKKIVTLSSDRLVLDGVSTIFAHFVDRSIRSINTDSLLDMAISFSKEGMVPFFTIKSSELNGLYNQFVGPIASVKSSMVIGIYDDKSDLSYLESLSYLNIINVNEYNLLIKDLSESFNNNKINVFVYKNKLINTNN